MGSELTPHPLWPSVATLVSDDFAAVREWVYDDNPFYVRQVREMLAKDIPNMMLFQGCQFYIYRDLSVSQDIVGFGTFQVTNIYCGTGNPLPHPYIPVLSTKPRIQSFGYGQSIVEHLISTAHNFSVWPNVSDVFYLEVYEENTRALDLYQRCGFETMTTTEDPGYGNKKYHVMARQV
jgi:ribosomal protein S18 acetylase RimI-like enzyme